MGGGALGSDCVSKLGSKEVSKKLWDFTLAPWGEGVRRTGEGSKVKIAQRVRDDKSTIVPDNETDKQLDCHVADAPRNDSNRHAELVSASQNETVFSRFTSHFSRKRTAFTLAEVLITLGIIGIVAALTLPSVVNNFKRKQLETAFKRSSSIIQTALNDTARDFGYDNFKDINKICETLPQSETNNCKSQNRELFNSINEDFVSKFRVLRKVKSIYAAQFEGKVIPIYNFRGKQCLYYSQFYGIEGGGYFLPDGTYITGLTFFYHGFADGVTLTFDTNGPYKGPNRYGYDIFIYTTGRWNLLCAKESAQPGTYGLDQNYNGRACYSYALKNTSPDDATKGYWESLYK